MRELLPLRIPNGWAVIFNNFVEFDELEDLDPMEVESYLSQDILTISQFRPTESGWATTPQGLILDVGWRPDGDLSGEYRMRVVDVDWDVKLRFEHRSPRVVRYAVETCLRLLSEGTAVGDVAAYIRDLEYP